MFGVQVQRNLWITCLAFGHHCTGLEHEKRQLLSCLFAGHLSYFDSQLPSIRKCTMMCIVENLGVSHKCNCIILGRILVLDIASDRKRCVKRLNKDDSPGE